MTLPVSLGCGWLAVGGVCYLLGRVSETRPVRFLGYGFAASGVLQVMVGLLWA